MYFDECLTCRLEVPEEKVKSVYKTAMMLKMASVAEACSTYLAKHLTPNNCLGEWCPTLYTVPQEMSFPHVPVPGQWKRYLCMCTLWYSSCHKASPWQQSTKFGHGFWPKTGVWEVSSCMQDAPAYRSLSASWEFEGTLCYFESQVLRRNPKVNIYYSVHFNVVHRKVDWWNP